MKPTMEGAFPYTMPRHSALTQRLSRIASERPLRILICRLSHIGDCLLTLPVVEALRESYPDAYIAWAVEKPTHRLLEADQRIDKLIVVDRNWMKRPASCLAMRRRLRKYRFDITLDPQSICKSALLARVSGAPNRLGFAGQHGRELSPWLNNCLVTPSSQHLVDRSLELLQGMGIPMSPARFALPIPTGSEQEMQTWLVDSCVQDSFVALNPGASWPSKRWECARFAAVARQIESAHGFKSVVTWAGEEEEAMANEIVASSDGAAVMGPRTNLTQLAALLQRARLFVGCDTGPLHLAATVGTACVGLHGPTRPQDSGAYGAQHVSVQAWYQAGTSRQRRQGPNEAMRDITVEQVVKACGTQLRPPNAAHAA